MSSSSYCQGLQSCLEPSRLAEPHVLAPPKSNFPARSSSPPPPKPHCITNPEEENNPKNNNTDVGGWSCLQSLCSQSQSQTHSTFNPPSMKLFSSSLRGKNLAMCTENLGSETGSEVCGGEGGNGEVAAFLSSENVEYNSTNYERQEQESNKGSRWVGNRRRYKRIVSFPPPLTSISSNSGVQVKPHRLGGRLVLKGFSVSSCLGYFHAERNNGRLTLHMMKDCSLTQYEHEEEEVEDEEEDEEVEEKEGEECNWEKELEGNNGNAGEEMGMAGKLVSRPVSSCKESESTGSKDLHNSGDPFWVAT